MIVINMIIIFEYIPNIFYNISNMLLIIMIK